MRFSTLNRFLLAVSVCVGGAFCSLESANADEAKTSAKAEANANSLGKGSPDSFLKAYFEAMSTATGPKDIEPYLDKEVKSKMMPGPDDAMLGPLFVEMIHSTHPVEVKIVSKKEAGDRVTYDLLPIKIPKACADMASQPTFSMTGTAILVKQDGLWKVHKDYWIAESKGKDGSMRMAFGTDPDKKDDNSAGGDSVIPKDYSSTLRDFFMDKWKQEGIGKNIYVSLKIGPNGEANEVNVGGETPQKDAEEQIRKAIASCQPLPALPQDQVSKPYVWMVFDWKDQGRVISGPYLDDHVPDWVVEKISGKSPSSAEKVQ